MHRGNKLESGLTLRITADTVKTENTADLNNTNSIGHSERPKEAGWGKAKLAHHLITGRKNSTTALLVCFFVWRNHRAENTIDEKRMRKLSIKLLIITWTILCFRRQSPKNRAQFVWLSAFGLHTYLYGVCQRATIHKRPIQIALDHWTIRGDRRSWIRWELTFITQNRWLEFMFHFTAIPRFGLVHASSKWIHRTRTHTHRHEYTDALQKREPTKRQLQ